MNEPRLRCGRCGRSFLESENHDAACSYHTGRLMDYDRVFQLGAGLPGDFWDCCSAQLQSEDDIGPGCAVGRHVEAAADDPGPIRRDFEEHERKMAQIIQEYHQDLHDSAPQEVKRARRLVQQFLAGDMDDLAALSLADLRILEGVSLAWLIARVGDTQYPLDRRRRLADLAQDPDTRAELRAGVDAEARQETNELERKRPIMDATPRWFTYDDVDGPKAVRLSPGEWIVGRGADCAIVVRDFGCSRRHAKLMVEVDGVRIVDLKSKGGTQVNKTPVTEARLKSGDEVRLGAVLFRFVVGPAPAAQAPKQRPGLAKLTAALERPAGTLREETRLGELGSSFAALMYAVHRVAEAFKVELPREPLLLINTVGELLDLIEQAGGRISEEG